MTKSRGSAQRNMEVAWQQLDVDGDGEITREELDYGLATLGVYLGDFDLNYVMNKCDADGNGTIDKDEFMAAFSTELLGPFNRIRGIDD